jgi:endonuclease-3
MPRATAPQTRNTMAPMPGARADGSIPDAAERGRARSILNRLKRRYPEIRTALDYENPWQLLVATVMSAQTTDENVNRVTPRLFARYPTPWDLAEARQEEVEEIIFSTGFYRQKARSIIELSQDLVARYDGEVPRDLEEMTTLRGVGRKTASVVLAEMWGDPAIAVDTHVKRVANRLGLTSSDDPTKIEFDLRALFPKKEWAGISMRVIQFGRDVCDARRPLCGECELFEFCIWPGRYDRAGRVPPSS